MSGGLATVWGSLLSVFVSGHNVLKYLSGGRYLQEVGDRLVPLVYLFTGLVHLVHIIYTLQLHAVEPTPLAEFLDKLDLQVLFSWVTCLH